MDEHCIVCQKPCEQENDCFMGLMICKFCLTSPGMIDSLATPIILFTENFKVKDINYAACECLGTNKSDSIGKVGGEVFNCLYSKLESGCGNTYHCMTCGLRDTLLSTQQTGESVKNITCKTELVNGNKVEDFKLTVNTKKVKNSVYLKFKMKKTMLAV